MRGYPYEQIIFGKPHNCTDSLNKLAVNEGYREKLVQRIQEHREDLEPLYALGFHGLDALVKSPKSLTYEQSFSLVTYVCMTSNQVLYNALASKVKGYSYGLLEKDTLRLQAVSLLQAMSTREGIMGLQAEEIAGLVAGAIELDTVARVRTSEDAGVFTLGGMGGDRGLKMDGSQSKLFSISTLAALALSDFAPVHKHHSYPNTSKVAGQSAIEAMGARSDFESILEMETVLNSSGVLMTSCHSIRTLHSISHALKGETINHVIGPLAVPHHPDSPVNTLVGVNHNVHPSTIVDALKILQQRGVQQYGNSVAFCGIQSSLESIPPEVADSKNYYANQDLKALVALDEIPPPPFTTMATFLIEGENAGTFLIAPSDFMDDKEIHEIQFDHLLIPNTLDEILAANNDVLTGTDHIKGKYIAMTVALGLFTKEYSHFPDALDHKTKRVNLVYLKECYKTACEIICSGELEKKARLYVEATQKDMLPGIDLVILDIDNTLVKPKDPNFYQQYSKAVNNAVSAYLGVGFTEGKRIADFYREKFGGGEIALFSGSIPEYFPEYLNKEPDVSILYDEMCRIDPNGQFIHDGDISRLLNILRAQGKKVVALTDSPEDLSRRVLAEVGIDPSYDFDLYLPYGKETGPYKILQGSKIFTRIAEYFGIPLERVISIGDSYHSDICPAEEAGIKACLVSEHPRQNYSGLQTKDFYHVFELYRRNL